MPVWDMKCEDCGVVYEDVTFRNFKDAEEACCPKCGYTLKRLPSSGSFAILGYNARNGYAHR
jgi:putative FmdB family regulatory protein